MLWDLYFHSTVINRPVDKVRFWGHFVYWTLTCWLKVVGCFIFLYNIRLYLCLKQFCFVLVCFFLFVWLVGLFFLQHIHSCYGNLIIACNQMACHVLQPQEMKLFLSVISGPLFYFVFIYSVGTDRTNEETICLYGNKYFSVLAQALDIMKFKLGMCSSYSSFR